MLPVLSNGAVRSGGALLSFGWCRAVGTDGARGPGGPGDVGGGEGAGGPGAFTGRALGRHQAAVVRIGFGLVWLA
ncbi:hypothetical protein ABZW03_37240, partial [Kitasatospora sp. NPDC004799]